MQSRVLPRTQDALESLEMEWGGWLEEVLEKASDSKAKVKPQINSLSKSLVLFQRNTHLSLTESESLCSNVSSAARCMTGNAVLASLSHTFPSV